MATAASPAERTLRFVERADLVLSATDDPRQGFERLAALVVPELGDLCAVWIADGAAPRALAVRHADRGARSSSPPCSSTTR